MDRQSFAPGALLLRNSILNFLGMAVPLLVGFAAIPLTIKGLGQDQFGILSIVLVVLGYLAMMDFGLSRATMKTTSQLLREGDLQDINTLIWTSLSLCFVIGLIGTIILYLITSWLVHRILNIPPALTQVAVQSLRIMALGMPFLIITINLKGLLGASQRFDLVNWVQIPIATLSFIIPALSLFLGFSLPKITIGIVLLRVVATFLLLILCFHVYHCITYGPQVSKRFLKPLFTYGGWVTLSGIINPSLVYLDRLFIGSLLSMSALTFYTAPMEGITRFRVIPTAIMNTLFPEFGKSRIQSDQAHILKLMSQSIRAILIPTAMASMLLFIYANDILLLWLGSEFVQEASTVFRIISISILFNFIALVPFTLLQAIGRPDIPAKFHALELIFYVPLVWLCITTWGLNGAAIAWSIRVILDAILLATSVSRHLDGISTLIASHQFKATLGILATFGISILIIHSSFHSLMGRLLPLVVLIPISIHWLWRYALEPAEKQKILALRPGR